MALTYEDYNAPATYTFSFPSIQESDIKVDVDGDIKSPNTHYNINGYTTTGGGTVVFTSGNVPTSPSIVRIFRQTNVAVAKATYQAGSSIRADDLNSNQKQLLFAAEEEQNQPLLASDLADSIITSAKIVDGAIAAVDIADNAVTSAKINADAVTNAKIADNSIDSEHYVDGSIDTAHIGDLQVTSGKIANSAITTDKIADSELSTLAGMQSGTASILSDTTALTATTTELNQLDGMVKETTITDDDTKFPTSGAVVDYVAAQIAPLGGLEVIATDAAFPNIQPSAGVVISISDAGGVVFNGSGTSTTGRTVGGSTVTINNAPSSLNNETLVAGVGLMVSSTGSGQIYNYHKILGKEDDIKQLSDDINDFNARYRVGSSNPSSALDAGDLFFNTTSSKLLVYNATASAWEEAQAIGSFFINTLSSSSGTGGGSATFNGSAYRFTLSNAGASAEQHIVSINGVIQKPNTGTSQPSEGFALDSSDIIFSAAPPSGASFFIITIGSSVNIGTPSANTVTSTILQNGSVTTSKIVNSNVTTEKLADESVTLAKLVHGTSSNNGKFLRANDGADPTFETIDLTALSATNLTSGTIPDARFPSTLPAVDGSNLTNIDTDLVNDTTPQLGGNLDIQSNNIISSGNGTITANSVASNVNGMRKITTSTSDPTSSDGADGDVWFTYTS